MSKTDLKLIQIICVLFLLISNVTSMQWWLSDSPITYLKSMYQSFPAYYNDTVYLLGGVGPSRYSLLRFNLDGSWMQQNLSIMNVEIQQRAQSSIQINNKLWYISDYRTTLNAFDLNELNITQTILFPGATTKYRCLTNYNEYILIAGGMDSNIRVYNDFNIYNTLTGEWTVGPNLINARYLHSCNVVSNTIYMIGGGRTNNIIIEYLEINSCCDGVWIQMNDTLSVQKQSHRSIVYRNNIYVIGGYNGSWQWNQVDVIDTISKTISSPLSNRLVYAIYWHSVIIADDIIYSFGGKPETMKNIYYQYASPVVTDSPTFSPTVSPSISPTYSPSMSPTNPPSNAPTTSPTRYPTYIHEFILKLEIRYEITNLYSNNI
eukprot:149915_1